MTDHQREIARSMYSSEPAHEVTRDGEMYRKYDADTELSPDLEQQRRKMLAEVDRVVMERDLAVAALKRIRDLGHSRSAAITTWAIAADVIDKLEGR